MGVYELSVVVDFAGEIRVALVGRLENNLYGHERPRQGVASEKGEQRTLEPLVSLCVAR